MISVLLDTTSSALNRRIHRTHNQFFRQQLVVGLLPLLDSTNTVVVALVESTPAGVVVVDVYFTMVDYTTS